MEQGRRMDLLSPRPEQAGIATIDLVGREPEIQQVQLLLGRIATGSGDALLLSGDPGVGKTSLLDLAAVLGADSGIRLLRATGSQFEADISSA
jgi:predicted ATP-dependent serine protease